LRVGISVRRAKLADLQEITRIYNHAVLNSTSTFDIEPITAEDRIEWFSQHSDEYPLLVAEVDGCVAGWASIRAYGNRAAYRFTVEDAVYVGVDYQGRGVGSKLLKEIVSLAKKLEYHVVLALIVGGNEASERLHVRQGFEHVGTLREVGVKFGRRLDVLIYEKLLTD